MQPTLMLASRQRRALLGVHATLKRRAPRTTCIEIFSPAAFLLILVIGYSFSHVSHFDAAVYAVLKLDMLPLIQVVASAGLDLAVWSPFGFDASTARTRSIVSGRLEIFHGGRWGTVCDDYWGLLDATVACKQLGLTVRASGYEFDAHGDPFMLDDVACKGTEDVLAACSNPGWEKHDCRAHEAVGILCIAEPSQLAAAATLEDTPAREGALRLAELVIKDEDDPTVDCRPCGQVALC